MCNIYELNLGKLACAGIAWIILLNINTNFILSELFKIVMITFFRSLICFLQSIIEDLYNQKNAK